MSPELRTAALILVMSLVTVLLRFLPFGVFAGKRQIPSCVLYLGRVLPGAVLGMLVIYCLRDISFSAPGCFLPELLACALTAEVQLLRRNSILSIVAGTLFYMLLLSLF